jgi:hypothetical protein
MMEATPLSINLSLPFRNEMLVLSMPPEPANKDGMLQAS